MGFQAQLRLLTAVWHEQVAPPLGASASSLGSGLEDGSGTGTPGATPGPSCFEPPLPWGQNVGTRLSGGSRQGAVCRGQQERGCRRAKLGTRAVWTHSWGQTPVDSSCGSTRVAFRGSW